MKPFFGYHHASHWRPVGPAGLGLSATFSPSYIPRIFHPHPQFFPLSSKQVSFNFTCAIPEVFFSAPVKVPGGLNSITHNTPYIVAAHLCTSAISPIDICKELCSRLQNISRFDRSFVFFASLIHSDKGDVAGQLSLIALLLAPPTFLPCGCFLCGTAWSLFLVLLPHNLRPRLKIHIDAIYTLITSEVLASQHLVLQSCVSAKPLHLGPSRSINCLQDTCLRGIDIARRHDKICQYTFVVDPISHLGISPAFI